MPASLTLARELSSGLSVGFGLFVAEQDLFDYQSSIRERDGTVQLDVSGALRGSVIRYHAGPSVGWHASKQLRLGVTLFAVYENEKEFRKLFADANMSGAYERVFLQRLVDARTVRIGSELIVGAQLDAGAGFQLGLSVRSPRWVFHEDADTDNSTALIATGPAVPTIATANVDHTPLRSTGTGITRPPRIQAGVAKNFDGFELSGEVEYRPQDIGDGAERQVINARAGALVTAGPDTLFGAGLFTDRNGAGKPRNFPQSRVDYYGATAGWKQRNLVKLKTGEDASSLVFSTTIAVRYAAGIGDGTRIRFDFSDTPNTGLVQRVDDEEVNSVDHEFSLYLGTGFEF